MNENIQKALSSAWAWIVALSPPKKIALGASLAIVLVLAGVTALILHHDPYEVVFSDLLPEEGKAVEKKLGEATIPFTSSGDHSIIRVPSSQVSLARMQLAKEGLPGQDVVGFEKFDASTLGMSSYVQRIQYVRAVQGELIRSIERLNWVKHARVHISVPPKKTFLEEEDPPKASVVLEVRAGMAPSKSEVRGIAHLVASAVEGLRINQVTIVDTKGGILHRPEDETSPAVSTALLEMERSIESEYEKRIEEILIPVVGLGKVRAKVTAEMDPARSNTTEETFDPDKTAVKNAIRNDESNQGSRPNPVGIPGSRSNLPGTEAQNPGGVPTATNSSEKNMQNTSYAVPRKVQVTDKPSGSIKRLTVAVVVDGVYSKGANPTFSPRTEEELKRFRELVGNAVGLDDSRRDNLTVTSLPFRLNEILPAIEVEPVVWYKSPDLKGLAIRYGLLGLGCLLVFFLVLRPMLRRLFARSETSTEVNSFPRTVAEIEAAGKEEGLLSLTKSAGLLEELEPLEKREESELKKRIMERLEGTPRKGFRIVQDWLEEEAGGAAAPTGEAA